MTDHVHYRPFRREEDAFPGPGAYGDPEPFFRRGSGFQAGSRNGALGAAATGSASRDAPPPLDPDAYGTMAPAARVKVAASPFIVREPRSIRPRQILHDGHYQRGQVSSLIAAPGTGKTSLEAAIALSMVSGRALLGAKAGKPLRVWIWNLEDSLDELERRLAAIVLHYGLSADDIGDRLFVDSGRLNPLVIATKVRDETVVAEPLVDELIREIGDRRIDVLIIDPFVSCHAVPENDNGAIDRVAKTWARIADATGCAVELVHHVRKQSGGPQSEVTVDDARGASALIGAVRSARVINVMTKDEAERADIRSEERRSYFRVDDGKANLRPLEKARWHRIVAVPLDNATDDDPGDWVGVVTSWQWPDALDDVSVNDLRAVQQAVADGQWREDVRAENWVGKAVASVLRLDAEDKAHRAKITSLLKLWTGNRMFVTVVRKDAQRRDRTFVEVGEWAS